MRKIGTLVYVYLVTGLKAMTIWENYGWCCHVDSGRKKKRKLGQILKMKELVIPHFSVFVGNGYVQDIGVEPNGEQALLYCTYAIPKG